MSLFVWYDPKAPDEQLHGLLADSPDHFGYAEARAITPYRRPYAEPYEVTNRGLRISLPLRPLLNGPLREYTASLQCRIGDAKTPLELNLVRLDSRDNAFARLRCNVQHFGKHGESSQLQSTSIYIPQLPQVNDLQQAFHYFRLTRQTMKRMAAAPQRFVDIIDSYEQKTLHMLFDHPGELPFNNTMFRVHYNSNGMPRLSLALTFRMSAASYTVACVRLGSFNHDQVGFDVVASESVVPSHSIRRSNQMQAIFDPHPFGTVVRYDKHEITVNAESFIRHGVRVFIVMVVIADPPSRFSQLQSGIFARGSGENSKASSIAGREK